MSAAVPRESSTEQFSFLRRLIEHLPVATYCKDYQSGAGKIVLWNRHATLLWGIKEDEALGKTDYDFFPKEHADFFREKDMEALTSGTPVFIKKEQVHTLTGVKTDIRTWTITLNDHGHPRYLINLYQNKNNPLEVAMKGSNTSVEITEASLWLENSGFRDADFYHDMMNQIAIVKGKTKQFLRAVHTGIQTEDHQRLQEQLKSVEEAIKRMQQIMETIRKNPHEAA